MPTCSWRSLGVAMIPPQTLISLVGDQIMSSPFHPQHMPNRRLIPPKSNIHPLVVSSRRNGIDSIDYFFQKANGPVGGPNTHETRIEPDLTSIPKEEILVGWPVVGVSTEWIPTGKPRIQINVTRQIVLSGGGMHSQRQMFGKLSRSSLQFGGRHQGQYKCIPMMLGVRIMVEQTFVISLQHLERCGRVDNDHFPSPSILHNLPNFWLFVGFLLPILGCSKVGTLEVIQMFKLFL
mmetsp:Transcript_1396/g.2502  ORF Transcript_1396/g.2502 Transcript_1396/m.2502 type:complete len:235 (+) Transcript_1396:450-1154(+)